MHDQIVEKKSKRIPMRLIHTQRADLPEDVAEISKLMEQSGIVELQESPTPHPRGGWNLVITIEEGRINELAELIENSQYAYGL